jgi:hypothetical protein
MKNSEIILYKRPQGNMQIDVRLQDETVWLSHRLIAELFQTTPQNITLYLKNILNKVNYWRMQFVRNSYKFKKRVAGMENKNEGV